MSFAYVQYASTLCFACAPFLSPKSLRQIGNLRFSERTPEVLANLSWEVRFLWVTDDGDSRVCSIRFNPLFRLRPVFSSKIIAPNLEPAVFGTNSGSASEPLMGGSFFAGNGEGIEALAKPIFVRGVSPFYGSGPAAPFYGSGTASPFNGSGPAALFNGSGAVAPFYGSGAAALFNGSGAAALSMEAAQPLGAPCAYLRLDVLCYGLLAYTYL